MNYRDNAPTSLKEITSNNIVTYFEDERCSTEELAWFKDIMTSPEYQTPTSPISRYNWGKIKTVFARKYFPEVAPAERSNSPLTIEDRLTQLFNN